MDFKFLYSSKSKKSWFIYFFNKPLIFSILVKFIIDFNDKVPSVFIILISSLSSINSIAGGVLHLYIKFTASVVSSSFCSISFISIYGFNSYASFFDASKWQYEANFSNILLYSSFCKYSSFASFPKTFFYIFIFQN